MEGEPLDIASLLYTPQGKPRVAIFSIAHLGDAERMFFVTMLLSAMLGWMRTQSGTSSLRAMLYMDEIFGFFPPAANPPSKAPMLTLLKQARAYGVGVVLATQNPVDLDYKGLGNTGTWFIGRLQTDRDKMRVLEALDGAMTGSAPLPRAEMDRLISGLGKRMFLMHNVHRGAPRLMETRWVMSYLAGPMTLAQVRSLDQAGSGKSDTGNAGTHGSTTPAATSMTGAPPVGGAPLAASANGPPDAVGTGAEDYATTGSGAPPTGTVGGAPLLPREIRQLFAAPFARASEMEYRPAFLAVADVRYASAKHGVNETRQVGVLVPLENDGIGFSLDRTESTVPEIETLETEPLPGAGFAPLPPEASQPRSHARWEKDVIRWIQGAHPITLYESRSLKAVSRPGESEREFRMRLADLEREARDAQAERIRRKYEPRFRTLQERLRRAEQMVERRTSESRQAMLNTGLSAIGAVIGAATGGRGRRGSGGLLGAFLGGGAARGGTAVRSAGRAAKSRQGVAHAAETVEAVQDAIEEMESEFQGELERLDDSNAAEESLAEAVVRPALNAISVRTTALVWLPWGKDPSGTAVALWR
jgi:hypothetical protein